MTARPQPRHIRIVIDAYPRNALGIIPRRSFKAAGALVGWCDTTGVDTAFIDPGSPWQNSFIEPFNAQFRREQLSRENMGTMAEGKYSADDWKAIYTHDRPTDPWTA